MERFARLVTGRPLGVLAVVGLLVGLAIPQLVGLREPHLRLEIDPSLERLLPEDEARRFYERIRLLFGSDEVVTVVLAGDAVFTPQGLASVRRMTDRLEALVGVRDVLSLSTAQDVRSQDGDLTIEPFLEELPATQEEARAIRDRVLGNPVYAGTLASREEDATALLVQLLDMPEAEFLESGLHDAIVRIAHEEGGAADAFVTGGSHVKAETSRLLLADVLRLTPFTIVVMALIALVSFRSVRGVVVPLLTIGAATLWTLALMAWLERPLSLVTTILPPLILTIGFAYAVHVVSQYYDFAARLRGEASVREVARRALGHVALPVLLTGLTTAAGFAALAASTLDAIREFAAFAVVAVLATLFASLTLAPALLAVLPAERRAAASEARESSWLQRGAVRLAELDIRHRRALFALAVGVAVLACGGVARIRVSADLITNFPESHPVRRDFEAVNERIGGSNAFYVVLRADERDAFKKPERLELLRSLQDWLEEQPEIGASTSLADYAVLLNRGFHEDDPTYARIPRSESLLSQLFFFGSSEQMERFVDSTFSTAGILARAKVSETRRMADLVERIEARLALLPEEIEGRVTGNPVLLARTLDALSRGQAFSLVAAFGVIYVILAALFTSFRTGLLALVPNALPVACYFGILGLVGFDLTPITSLVACIILGIAVDDTIHFLSRYNTSSREMADERRGVVEALRTVIRPVTFTTVALCAGFLVLTTSTLRDQVEFGALAAMTLAVAWVVDVTVTPALCTNLRTVTLWDVLSLDLGREPQRSVPLFEGLSSRQARIFALMAEIRHFRTGQMLAREGEIGRAMYVILEGRLRSSVCRGNRRVELAEMGRGDVMGETGLFSQWRSADVEALSDGRMIEFETDDLERLRRRYPKTAATLFRNLNRLQADRLVRTTGRVA